VPAFASVVKGGNTYQVQAFGRGTNLHSLWDNRLIENWPGNNSRLRRPLSGGCRTKAALGV